LTSKYKIKFIIKLFRFYCHHLEKYTIEQFSSLDKVLKSIYEDVSKIDNNSLMIAKVLSNTISMGVFASQSIIQEIPIKNCKFILN
jgi:hypothetical protein